MIDTVALGLLHPSLLHVAPDTGTQWLDYFLAHAAADVAMRTRVLRAESRYDAQANVDNYPIEVPAGYTLAFVERVCVGSRLYTANRDLTCGSGGAGEISPCHPRTDCDARSARDPWFSLSTDGKSIRLYPAPSEDIANGVEIELSLVPARDACTLATVLYERHAQTIVSLALSSLLLDPKMKTNPRTLNIVERRSGAALRRSVQDSADVGIAGPTAIRPNVMGVFV